jgi:hypothetical protein
MMAGAALDPERDVFTMDVVYRRNSCPACGRPDCRHANRALCDIDRQYRSGTLHRAGVLATTLANHRPNLPSR